MSTNRPFPIRARERREAPDGAEETRAQVFTERRQPTWRKFTSTCHFEPRNVQVDIHDQLISSHGKRSANMSQLIVVGFKKDLLRASHVLNELQELNDDWV